MSKPQRKEELTRLAWLVALRQNGHRQCVLAFATKNPNEASRVCALGLLYEVSGADPLLFRSFAFDIAALAGLNDDQSDEIVARNDGDGRYHKHTFAEIADVVEEWFSPYGMGEPRYKPQQSGDRENRPASIERAT